MEKRWTHGNEEWRVSISWESFAVPIDCGPGGMLSVAQIINDPVEVREKPPLFCLFHNWIPLWRVKPIHGHEALWSIPAMGMICQKCRTVTFPMRGEQFGWWGRSW